MGQGRVFKRVWSLGPYQRVIGVWFLVSRFRGPLNPPVVPLLYYCTSTALLLYYFCSTTVLLPPCYCILLTAVLLYQALGLVDCDRGESVGYRIMLTSFS